MDHSSYEGEGQALEVLEFLLQQPGIDVNVGSSGMSGASDGDRDLDVGLPLKTATLLGNLQAVELLLATKGIDVNGQLAKDSKSNRCLVPSPR